MAPEEIKYSWIFLSTTTPLPSYFVAKKEETINMLTYYQKPMRNCPFTYYKLLWWSKNSSTNHKARKWRDTEEDAETMEMSVLKPKSRDNLDNINFKEQKIILKIILPILHHNVIKPSMQKIYKNNNTMK